MSFKTTGLAAGMAVATAMAFAAAVPASDRAGLDTLPSAETVTVSPDSFEHPQPGEFLLANGRPAPAPRSRVEIREALEIMRFQVSLTSIKAPETR